MQAAFYEGNRTIRIGESQPVAPGQGQVQIRVSHVGICGTDLHIFHGAMDKRVRMPQIMGHEMSGTIAAVGPDVTGFAPGDRVTVRPLEPHGSGADGREGRPHLADKLDFLGIDTPGAMQTYWTVPAHTLHHLPPNLSLAHGALIEPLAVACHDVRVGEVQPGEYAVVLGGGPIGALVALVARAKGARVLDSVINPCRVDLLRGRGLQAINPQETDLAARVLADTDGKGADVVFEVTGAKAGAEVMTQLPRIYGRIIIVGIFSQPAPVDLFRFFWRELKLFGARVYAFEDFEEAIALAAAGSLPLDQLITDTLPLSQLEAGLHQMESGGGVMKILLEVGE